MPQDTNDEAKYYAVSVGRKCGIYDDWETAKRQVNGYSGNRYQGYRTERGAINYMKKEGFKEPQLFYSHNTSNSKQTTFSSSGITTTTSTGASSNPMATKEVGTGPGVLINNQSDTPIMKSVGTGDEARQNNHNKRQYLFHNFTHKKVAKNKASKHILNLVQKSNKHKHCLRNNC